MLPNISFKGFRPSASYRKVGNLPTFENEDFKETKSLLKNSIL
jgi:hypothetical protein